MIRKSASATPAATPHDDGGIHFERNARIFASDGPVGILRQLIVDERTGEISMLVISPEDGSPAILVPAGLVLRSAGSALFLSVTRSQFARAAARAARFDGSAYQRANLKRALNAAGRGTSSPLPMLRAARADAAEAAPPSAGASPQPAIALASPAIEIGFPSAPADAAAPRRLIPSMLPRRRNAASRPLTAAAGD